MNAPAASILVVDDEPDLRTLYELTLLREGYRVETASNVQEAREQLKAQRFDAVITDMRLPDGFGMELLQDLRDQQRRERCVVMTAYGSAENAVEALRAGGAAPDPSLVPTVRPQVSVAEPDFDVLYDAVLRRVHVTFGGQIEAGGEAGDEFGHRRLAFAQRLEQLGHGIGQ